jgi:hypothetical protein
LCSTNVTLRCTHLSHLVDGEWSLWGAWEGCSSTCGIGLQFRYRKCDNPAPSSNGRLCLGDAKDVGLCNIPCVGKCFCLFVHVFAISIYLYLSPGRTHMYQHISELAGPVVIASTAAPFQSYLPLACFSFDGGNRHCCFTKKTTPELVTTGQAQSFLELRITWHWPQCRVSPSGGILNVIN